MQQELAYLGVARVTNTLVVCLGEGLQGMMQDYNPPAPNFSFPLHVFRRFGSTIRGGDDHGVVSVSRHG